MVKYMAKIDLKRELKNLYTVTPGAVSVVDVPPMHVLMIDGHGDPNSAAEYKAAVEALYGLAYPLKFRRKKDGRDYTVMPLEGLWWAEDMREFSVDHKGDWLWTMMIMQPLEVTPELFAEVLAEVKRRKDAPALDHVRFEQYDEGRSAQVMHVGSYAAEGPAIQRLHAFIEAEGFERRGKHHEIYLGDPNKSAPEKLRTILRQPVAERAHL